MTKPGMPPAKEGFLAKQERESVEGAVLYAKKNGLLCEGKAPCSKASGISPGWTSRHYLLKTNSGELICEIDSMDVSKAFQDNELWKKEQAVSGGKSNVTRVAVFGAPRADQWEYLYIRYASAGSGDKNEMSLAMINGDSYRDFVLAEALGVRTVADLLNAAGEAGWELVNHSPIPSSQFHFLAMKRKKSSL